MFTWHVFACLLFLFFLDVSCRRASSTWSLCGSEGDSLLNVTDVFFSHPLPGRGSSWTITVRGWLNSDNPVLDGHSQTEVWWGRIKLQSKVQDYCKQNLCPVYPGPTLQSVQTHLPKLMPPGTYVVVTSSHTSDGRFIGCLRISFLL
eukprot:EG_transcript_22124